MGRETTERADGGAAGTKKQATKREEGAGGERCEARRRAGSLCLCIMSAAGSEQDATAALARVWREDLEPDSLKFQESKKASGSGGTTSPRYCTLAN